MGGPPISGSLNIRHVDVTSQDEIRPSVRQRLSDCITILQLHRYRGVRSNWVSKRGVETHDLKVTCTLAKKLANLLKLIRTQLASGKPVSQLRIPCRVKPVEVNRA